MCLVLTNIKEKIKSMLKKEKKDKIQSHSIINMMNRKDSVIRN